MISRTNGFVFEAIYVGATTVLVTRKKSKTLKTKNIYKRKFELTVEGNGFHL